MSLCFPTFRLIEGLLRACSEGPTCMVRDCSPPGCALRGSSSPSRSVKTVLASDVDGEGAVMSSGVVAVSSACGLGDK